LTRHPISTAKLRDSALMLRGGTGCAASWIPAFAGKTVWSLPGRSPSARLQTRDPVPAMKWGVSASGCQRNESPPWHRRGRFLTVTSPPP